MGTPNSDMEKITEMFTQINQKLQNMDDKLEFLIEENSRIKEENKRLKDKVIVQEQKIGSLEREILRKNIIIRGIEDKEEENREETAGKLMTVIHKLGIQIRNEDIDEIKRIGKYIRDRQRPILLKLTTGNKKIEILRKSKDLKGTNIWLEDDYTKEVLAERKWLIPQMKEARNKGYKAYLKYNKLVVNDEIYGIDDLKIHEEETVEKPVETNTENGNKKRTASERSPANMTETEHIKKVSKTKN